MFGFTGLLFGSCLMFGMPAANAQSNKLSIAIENEAQNKAAVHLPLFKISSSRDAIIDNEIDNVTYLKLDTESLKSLRKDGLKFISFELPVDGKNQTFNLYSYNIIDAGFKVFERGSDGIKKEVAYNTGSFFRGALANKENSLASFSFYDDDIAGIFSILEKGNYNLVLNYENPGINKDNYLLFKESDVRTKRTAGCGVTDAHNIGLDEGNVNTAARGAYSSCKTLRVSLHADYRLYQRRNNSTTSATSYLTSLFNNIAVLFDNEGIVAALTEVVINSAPDGYTYGGSDEVLTKFGEDMQTMTMNGDIAQMVSGYRQWGSAPLGGLAWLNVLCVTPINSPDGEGGFRWVGPYSMSNNDILNNIPQIPIYSWDVNASIHEMGHNIGSPHTQSCTWAGGAIDDCYPTEGSCSPGPTPVNGGTIMSYCHLDNPGVNFALGFGPLPGQLIRSRMVSRACLTGFQPTKTITTANVTRIANRQCDDGVWTSYYFDNNTVDLVDDELLLMVRTNNQNIGNVDSAGVEISMTTLQSYNTGIANTITAPYGSGDWKEINRTWKVTLPAGSQPTANVSVRFPFTNQDFTDIQGSYPTLASANEMSLVNFTNQAAANNPATATLSATNFYANGNTASTTAWRLVTGSEYNYAEFISSNGIFGGSLGYRITSGLDKINSGNLLSIYPNPASTELFIQLPQGAVIQNESVTVFDNLGRVVIRKSSIANNGMVKINVSDLSSGVYSVRLQVKDQSFKATFVKKN